MTTSERAVVAALEQAICQRIGAPRYQLWFPDKTKFTWAGNEIAVGVPNHFYLEWLKKQFADVVGAAAADVYEPHVEQHDLAILTPDRKLDWRRSERGRDYRGE